MNKSICPICHKEFSITLNNKIHKHGYKYKIIYRTYNGLFEINKTYRKKISPPCKGSGKKIKNIK